MFWQSPKLVTPTEVEPRIEGDPDDFVFKLTMLTAAMC